MVIVQILDISAMQYILPYNPKSDDLVLIFILTDIENTVIRYSGFLFCFL